MDVVGVLVTGRRPAVDVTPAAPLRDSSVANTIKCFGWFDDGHRSTHGSMTPLIWFVSTTCGFVELCAATLMLFTMQILLHNIWWSEHSNKIRRT